MNNKEIIILSSVVLFLIFLIGFLGCGQGRSISYACLFKQANDQGGALDIWSKKEGIKPAEKTIDENSYQQELKNIINSSPINDVVAAAAAKNRVLALVVPAQYRQLHLDIVIALTHLEQGDNLGRQELDQIIKENAWLNK